MTTQQNKLFTKKACFKMNALVPEFKITLRHKKKGEPLVITSNKDIYEACQLCFDADEIEWKESFIVICLNQSNTVAGFYKVSSGGITGTIADPKVIFQVALLSNATSIIIAHNHPSGNLKASQEDIKTTDKIREAGRLLDIRLLDSIIITKDGYTSIQNY